MNAIITPTGCKNCKFSAPAPKNMRECRFGPPTANAVLIPDGNGGINVAGIVSVFPQMNPDQVCGRYERGFVLGAVDAVGAA